jgi:hypothetical protein
LILIVAVFHWSFENVYIVVTMLSTVSETSIFILRLNRILPSIHILSCATSLPHSRILNNFYLTNTKIMQVLIVTFQF